MSRPGPILALVFAVTVAACAQSPRPAAPRVSPASVPSPAPLPAMWTTHADPAQGFTLAIPDAWDFVQVDSPTLASDLDTVGRHSPYLQSFFKNAIDANHELRFLAADPRSLANNFASNVNVTSSDLGPAASAPSLGELAQAKLNRLESEPGVVRPVKRVATQVQGSAAVRFDYGLTAGSQVVMVRSFLLVPGGDHRRLVELTMAAPGGDNSEVFDTVARSFSPPA